MRNIIGTTLSPLSAEIKRGRQEPRGILHFAPAAFILGGERPTMSTLRGEDRESRDERSYHSNFCILSLSLRCGSLYKREDAQRENIVRDCAKLRL